MYVLKQHGLRFVYRVFILALWASSLELSLVHFCLANVVGPDMQNFNATPDGLDYVTVESSKVLAPGFWNFGLFVNDAVNTLPRFPEDGSGRPSGSYSDNLLGMDINVAVGVVRRLSLGLSLPQVLMQSVKDSSGVERGGFEASGTTEIRPMAKYQIYSRANSGLAGVLSAGINMVENNPYTGNGAPPIINMQLVVDHSFGVVSGAVNVGYRYRKPGAGVVGAPVDPLGSQYIASVGANWLVSSIKSRLIGEIFGGAPAQSVSNRSDRALSSVEALVGIKHMATDELALHAGLGHGLVHGIASPDVRAYLGVNLSLGPHSEAHAKETMLRRPATPPRAPKKVINPTTPPVDPAPTSYPDYVPPDTNDLVQTNAFADHGPPVPGEETFVISNVLFAFDRDNLVTPGGRDILNSLADYLMRAPVFKHLVIEGHTDFIGSVAYNLDLSMRRANQIRRYLVEVLHLDPNRISTVGYGESRPIADNGNYQGRQLNRRVEFKISR